MKNKINIYLDKEDRKKLDATKVKYQLSLTTIVDILIYTTINIFNRADNREELLEMLKEEYMHKRGAKTSIAEPKIFRQENLPIFRDSKHKARFTTNVIKIYLYKDIGKYIKDEKLIQKYWNDTNNKMLTTKDQFWHYNESIRYQRRMIKENKDYWRKALEQ